MQRSIGRINKPIFIVGSPRSGTSVLTWCLGQHLNIIPLEESGWIGHLTIDLAICYQIGTALGDRSLLSSMGVEQQEFFSTFGNSINELILRHRVDLERKRWERAAGPNALPEWFFLWKAMEHRWESKTAGNPKARWVDGTPEYSFHICGLRKLFPEARFIHVVRDVTSVVRSLLNFFPDGRKRLVANEQEAYNYWLRTVTACVEAERAYGPSVVYRVLYSDFTGQPEPTMRLLLDFLGEPYAAECLEPLVERINSSNVPVDFDEHEPTTDPKIIEQARRLNDHLQDSPQPSKASTTTAEKLEAEFNQQVQYFLDLEGKYSEAQRLIGELQKEACSSNAR